MAVRCCWILAGTGTRCHIRRSIASQTCSKGDMSGEYAGHAGCFQFPGTADPTPVRWMNYLGKGEVLTNMI